MWNFLRKSSNAAVDPRDARIKELEEEKRFLLDRAEKAEALAKQHSQSISELEALNQAQASRNGQLFRANLKLAQRLAPFIAKRPRNARGHFISTKQSPTFNAQVSA